MKKDIIQKIREFNRFYTGIIGLTNNHILESEYSLSEVRVMFEIYHNQNITARQIKRIMQIDEGYLSRLISKLVKQNIILKTKSEHDNREYTLALSKTGEEIFLKLNRKSSDSISEIINHLNTDEQEELARHFESIITLLIKKIDAK